MSSNTQPGKRIYYIDAARSTLMTLGVFMHSALVYSVGSTWMVRSQQSDSLFNIISFSLSYFRNEAFFLISGFFALMIIDRYGVSTYLKRNLVRVTVPTLFVGFLFNLPESVLMSQNPGKEIMPTTISLANIISGGIWVYHLWFLTMLFVFFSLLALIYPYLGTIGSAIETHLFKRFNWYPKARQYMLLTIAGIALVYIVMLALAKIMPVFYENVLFFDSPFRTMHFLIFFTIGALMRRYPDYLTRFYADGYQVWIAALVLYLASQYAFTGGLLHKITINLAYMLSVMAIVHLFMMAFRFLFDQKSAFWSYMSGASYTIYLLHHVIVVFLAIMLLNVDLSNISKYLILVTFGLSVPLLVHEFIVLRSPLARFLLNGRAMEKRAVEKKA